MNFIWDENNQNHVASHRVSRDLAEMVFEAGRDALAETDLAYRYLTEANVNGREYRLACDISNEGAIYIVTVFPL